LKPFGFRICAIFTAREISGIAFAKAHNLYYVKYEKTIPVHKNVVQIASVSFRSSGSATTAEINESLRELDRKGLRAGRDISIVGFNDVAGRRLK
jgi:hypothetical protein